MDGIRAPYNFVPLAPRVVWPDWWNVPAQDTPFEDGIAGTLDIEIEAKTPIFIRGSGSGPSAESFFAIPGIGPAIPGSEVRGLIRNVVEIATFGKLSRFNRHRYAVRDLQNRDLYLKYMADLLPSEEGGPGKLPMPLVDAGWLQRLTIPGDGDKDGDDEIVAEVRPCDFAKIHYNDLTQLTRIRGVPSFSPGGRKQSAAEKYRAWGAPKGEEETRRVKIDFSTLRPNGNGAFLSDYGKATLGTEDEGYLVFTGQPQKWESQDPGNKAKRHDFVFCEPEEDQRVLAVPRSLLKDFAFVHADRGQQGRLVDGLSMPNEEWGFWLPIFNAGGRVPVFFLRREDGTLRAMGLAMMFRLAYAHAVRDGVLNAQADAESPRLDLAELIFGRVDEGRAKSAQDVETRRGRVSFGLMRATEPARKAATVKGVFGAPKASYYPNYVEQGPGFGDAPVGKDSYKTFMDPDVRVRGWKRYRPHEVARPIAPPGPDQQRVATSFTPLEQGTIFRGTLRVHNLRRVELGALLWALDFGGPRQRVFSRPRDGTISWLRASRHTRSRERSDEERRR